MNKVVAIVKGKCPICGEGAIFESKGSLLRLKMPVMHEKCPNCAYRFDKEPGYFFGAMYLSYGLAVGELIPVFLILAYFLALPWIFVCMLLVLLVTMFFNFRMARILWIHIFHE